MVASLPEYTIGDWVVHHSYGVGQIRNIEVKPIHGEQVKCFRVKTKDSAFWFPKNRPDNPRIRPVVTPDIIERVIEALQNPVIDMDPDRKMWKKRIDEAKASDDLIATSQIVRDLNHLRTQRKLNQTEERALNDFTDRLIDEWSTAMKTDSSVVRRELNEHIQAIKALADVS
ncbi:MAG: CarD family transcriptional regulator [Anaerolineales bacterium]|jgi:RNA polymerase-interacting CarD/CdnL/TRCF family regulator